MRNLLRKPLIWMVLAEFAVVTALVMLAWHLVASAGATVIPALPFVSPPAQASGVNPLPADLVQPSNTPDRRLLPGLNLGASFWRSRLTQLNQGEASFETLQWKIVHAALDAARRYVESVVLPSVASAEQPHR